MEEIPMDSFNLNWEKYKIILLSVFYSFQRVSKCQWKDTGQTCSRDRKIHCSSKLHSLGSDQCGSNNGNCNYDSQGMHSIPTGSLVCFPFLKHCFLHESFLHFLQRKLIIFNIIYWTIPFQFSYEFPLTFLWTFLYRHLLHHSCRPTEVSNVPICDSYPSEDEIGNPMPFFSGWGWKLKS